MTPRCDTSPAPTDTNPEVQHDTVQLEHLLQVQLQGHALHTCGHRAALSQGHIGDMGTITSHFLLSSPFTELNTTPCAPQGVTGSSLCPGDPGGPHRSGTATSARGRPRTGRSPRGARCSCGAASSHTCSTSCSTAKERTAGVTIPSIPSRRERHKG